MGTSYAMRLIKQKTLQMFYEKHSDSKVSLLEWAKLIKEVNWKTPNEIKSLIGSASILEQGRVVFNVQGNKYRLIVDFDFKHQLVFVVWLGNHRDYDRIDARTVVYSPNQK